MHQLRERVATGVAIALGHVHTSLAAAAVQAAVMLLSVHGTLAQETTVKPISVEHAWSRATPNAAQVAVGYLTIENNGTTPDRFVSATAEIAGHTELHQMTMADGVMKMRQVMGGLPVPAKGSVVLEPGSYHLMFFVLRRQLKEGEQFSGTLTFETAGTVDVTFDVEGVGATAPKPAEHGHNPTH